MQEMVRLSIANTLALWSASHFTFFARSQVLAAMNAISLLGGELVSVAPVASQSLKRVLTCHFPALRLDGLRLGNAAQITLRHMQNFASSGVVSVCSAVMVTQTPWRPGVPAQLSWSSRLIRRRPSTRANLRRSTGNRCDTMKESAPWWPCLTSTLPSAGTEATKGNNILVTGKVVYARFQQVNRQIRKQ